MAERADYGLNEKEIGFDTDENKWLQVPEDYESVKLNPIYSTLSAFRKEFIKNERLSYDVYLQLETFLIAFSEVLNSNPYYKEMDIVKMMDSILDRYKSWMTTMRYNAILGKEKMIEIQQQVEDEYMTKRDYNEAMDELEILKEKSLDEIKATGEMETAEEIQKIRTNKEYAYSLIEKGYTLAEAAKKTGVASAGTILNKTREFKKEKEKKEEEESVPELS